MPRSDDVYLIDMLVAAREESRLELNMSSMT